MRGSRGRQAPSLLSDDLSPQTIDVTAGGNLEPALRDPFTVLARFGVKLASDQIDSDTATRFNEFVFQRLSRKAEKSAKTVYVHCAEGDRASPCRCARSSRRRDFHRFCRPPKARRKSGKPPNGRWSRSLTMSRCAGAPVSQCALLQELSEESLALWKAEQ